MSLGKSIWPVSCPRCFGQRACKFEQLQDVQDAIDTLESLKAVLEKADQDASQQVHGVEKVEISGGECWILRKVRCGKAGCKCTREGGGHGPYWYAYSRKGGRVTCRYVGKVRK